LNKNPHFWMDTTYKKFWLSGETKSYSFLSSGKNDDNHNGTSRVEF
jgi:hypothetical protein